MPDYTHIGTVVYFRGPESKPEYVEAWLYETATAWWVDAETAFLKRDSPESPYSTHMLHRVQFPGQRRDAAHLMPETIRPLTGEELLHPLIVAYRQAMRKTEACREALRQAEIIENETRAAYDSAAAGSNAEDEA